MSQLQSDFVQNQVNRPVRVGSALPTTCRRGEVFFLVGTVNQTYLSLAANVWTPFNLASAVVPATSSDTGIAGQIAFDGAFIYVCTATNTWLRAPLSDWP